MNKKETQRRQFIVEMTVDVEDDYEISEEEILYKACEAVAQGCNKIVWPIVCTEIKEDET